MFLHHTIYDTVAIDNEIAQPVQTYAVHAFMLFALGKTEKFKQKVLSIKEELGKQGAPPLDTERLLDRMENALKEHPPSKGQPINRQELEL